MVVEGITALTWIDNRQVNAYCFFMEYEVHSLLVLFYCTVQSTRCKGQPLHQEQKTNTKLTVNTITAGAPHILEFDNGPIL